MHAVRQERLGDPDVLTVVELPDLVPGAGQVRVAVEAAGVHLVDTVIRRGELHVPTELPSIPGREVAGRVDAVGEGVDESWIGRRVVAHLGLAGGGYAEQAVVDLTRLHETPSLLTSDTAVAAIGTGRTAAGVLDHAPIAPDDRVVVTAASGGLGALLVREARRVGATVVGLAGGPDKVRAVRRLGATEVVDSRSAEWEADLKLALDGRQPTLVLDGVGDPVASALFAMLAPGGVLASYSGLERPVGDDAGRRFVPVLGPALTSRPGGLRSLEAVALARANDGSRVPFVGRAYPLVDAARAHADLEARRTIGKVVLDPRLPHGGDDR